MESPHHMEDIRLWGIVIRAADKLIKCQFWQISSSVIAQILGKCFMLETVETVHTHSCKLIRELTGFEAFELICICMCVCVVVEHPTFSKVILLLW